MDTELAASRIAADTVMLPIAGLTLRSVDHTADSDSECSWPTAFVKDSVITIQIKVELAEETL